MSEYEIINRIAMALAMCDGTPPEHFRALDEPTIYGYRRRAWAAVAACKAALTDAGYVIVPREPTREMSDAIYYRDDWDHCAPDDVWKTMLGAAPTSPVSPAPGRASDITARP